MRGPRALRSGAALKVLPRLNNPKIGTKFLATESQQLTQKEAPTLGLRFSIEDGQVYLLHTTAISRVASS